MDAFVDDAAPPSQLVTGAPLVTMPAGPRTARGPEGCLGALVLTATAAASVLLATSAGVPGAGVVDIHFPSNGGAGTVTIAQGSNAGIRSDAHFRITGEAAGDHHSCVITFLLVSRHAGATGSLRVRKTRGGPA